MRTGKRGCWRCPSALSQLCLKNCFVSYCYEDSLNVCGERSDVKCQVHASNWTSSDLPEGSAPRTYRDKILVHWDAIRAAGLSEMRLDIQFNILPLGRMAHRKQIQHELGHHVGGGKVRRIDMRRIQRGDHLVPVSILLLKTVGNLAQLEPVVEKVMDHIHASGFTILQNDNGDSGGRHP